MLPPRTRACVQCLRLSRFYSTAKIPCSEQTQIHPPHPPASGVAKLTNRRLVALYGQDAPHFLQGMVTNNVTSSGTRGFYAAFLNAQGRILNDVFIYPASQIPHHLSTSIPPNTPIYLVEADALSTTPLLSHIRRHKLRAKFTATLLDPFQWSVYSIWDSTQKWTPLHTDSKASREIGCVDPRAPGMGRRVVVFHGDGADERIEETTTLEAYTVRRILHGVAEGQAEILPGVALPHESNIDYMSGIDFRKGCYVGQELTIRTHHTGIVRKRILPINLYSPPSPPPQTLSYDPQTTVQAPATETGISRVIAEGKEGGIYRGMSPKSTGKFLGAVGDVGLALCRLESMTDVILTGEGGGWNPRDEFELVGGDVRVKAFVPGWHHSRESIGGKSIVGH
ncbi:MAG: ccr4 associated factor [Trichoglossum hirsutum]|nr:MAG: ccr4 associated factor [Trichoglossum hirsutum]